MTRCSDPGHDNSHGIRLPGGTPSPVSAEDLQSSGTKLLVERLTRDERETVVLELPECGVVLFDSTVRPDISRMRRLAHYYTEVAHGYYGTTEWVRFSLPLERWNSRTGRLRARRSVSPERAALLRARVAGFNRARPGQFSEKPAGRPRPDPAQPSCGRRMGRDSDSVGGEAGC